MDKIERVLTTIAHREPDRVPMGELNIQDGLCARLAPEGGDAFAQAVLARERLHMDLVVVDIDWPPPTEIVTRDDGHRLVTDVLGRTLEWGDSDHRVIRPGVNTPEEAIAYHMPAPDLYATDRIRRWTRETDFFVFGLTGGVYHPATEICGFENMMLWSIEEPQAARALAAEIARFHIWAAAELLAAGAHGIVVGDDLAYNSGTFLHPKVLRAIFFPLMHDIVTSVKAIADVPVFLHSDGDLNAIIPDIVAMGFDGMQSLQPSANMDITAIKKEWGDHLTLWGNIDQDMLIPFGPPGKIAQVVEDTVRACAPGGGYIFSSTNTLMADLPLDHVTTMYDTAERVGRTVA